MTTQLKCCLLLSLEEIALRRLAVFFWNDSAILASISKFKYDEFETDKSRKEWREKTEDKIIDKTLKLDLPKLLLKKMISIIKSISLEIRRWKFSHEDFFHEGIFQSSEEIGLPISAQLHWTATGRIDNKKTAEELVHCDGLDLRNRYELAGLYCFEETIPVLWEKLPEEQKEYFTIDCELLPDLHFCWSHIFKGEHSRLEHLFRSPLRNLSSFEQWAFQDSAVRGNKTAAEYFFQKLTVEERETSLLRTAHTVLEDFEEAYCLAERQSDVVFYLLTLMTPDQQVEIAKAHPADLLLCFLYWPWQDLLLDNANLIWSFLPPSGYKDLLQKMTAIFRRYSPRSFSEFFSQSPLNFRKWFVASHFGSTPACRFLSIFFRNEDPESIETVFRYVEAVDRVKLVFHRDVLELFYKSILRDRWQMVEVCLREAMLSKVDRKKMEKAFAEFLENGACVNWKFKRLFEFLDKADVNALL